MSTVIKFPKHNPRITPDQSLEQVQEKIVQAKEKYINALVDHHSSQLLAGISLSGLDIDTDEFMKDFAFTVETIRSTMYRSMGMDHPLQESIDEVINVVEKEEDPEFLDGASMVMWDDDDED